MIKGYVKVSRLDHYGEHAVPLRKVNKDEVEFVLLDCKHGHHRVTLTRKDIC